MASFTADCSRNGFLEVPLSPRSRNLLLANGLENRNGAIGPRPPDPAVGTYIARSSSAYYFIDSLIV
ncbi:MAG TPA: hypothetical protein ENI77_08360 [Nitrospirae bacterium]|nr:hypothetical protein [Nitrospirota bacterium]